VVCFFTVVGLFVFARSTYVKEKFRRTPHDPCFAGTELFTYAAYL